MPHGCLIAYFSPNFVSSHTFRRAIAQSPVQGHIARASHLPDVCAMLSVTSERCGFLDGWSPHVVQHFIIQCAVGRVALEARVSLLVA